MQPLHPALHPPETLFTAGLSQACLYPAALQGGPCRAQKPSEPWGRGLVYRVSQSLPRGPSPGIYAGSSDVPIGPHYLCCAETGLPPGLGQKLLTPVTAPTCLLNRLGSTLPRGIPDGCVQAGCLVDVDFHPVRSAHGALLGLRFRAEPPSKTQWSHI